MQTNNDCEILNRKFGAPGRIVFRPSQSGAPVISLANQYGSAEIALFSGTILSYRPTGNLPVLFQSKSFNLGGKAWQHGGIPVCWPWFGKNGPTEDSPGHGFARWCTFSVRGSEYSEDESTITLGLKPNDETRKIWPYEFDLEFKISLSMKLNLFLKTKNTDTKSFRYTEGFHPYFLVKDRNGTTVRGIDGCSYCDARKSRVADAVWTGDLEVKTGFDHVFTVTKTEYALLDPNLKRAIAMVSRGNKKLVVWNPDTEYVIDEADVDCWRHFVCVEPATLFREDAIELKPGEEHSLIVAIQSVMET